MERELKLKLDENGFPMAPSQAEWDAMTPEERAWVVAALPGRDEPESCSEEDDWDELMEMIHLRREAERQLAELVGGRAKDALRWRRSDGWRKCSDRVRRRTVNTRSLHAARHRSDP